MTGSRAECETEEQLLVSLGCFRHCQYVQDEGCEGDGGEVDDISQRDDASQESFVVCAHAESLECALYVVVEESGEDLCCGVASQQGEDGDDGDGDDEGGCLVSCCCRDAASDGDLCACEHECAEVSCGDGAVVGVSQQGYGDPQREGEKEGDGEQCCAGFCFSEDGLRD